MTIFNINTLQDLIKLAESNKLTPEQFYKVMEQCQPFVGIFINEYKNTSQMATVMKEYLSVSNNEVPIFWDTKY